MKLKNLAGTIIRLFRKGNGKQQGTDPPEHEEEITWETVVYCDNPQCKNPIGGGFVAYDPIQRTVYHPYCECELYAAHYPILLQNAAFTAAKYIHMKTAQAFYNQKKLAQSTNISRLIEEIEAARSKKPFG